METKGNNWYLVNEKFSDDPLRGFVPDCALIDDSFIQNQPDKDIPETVLVGFMY